jgi:hypothetical protein
MAGRSLPKDGVASARFAPINVALANFHQQGCECPAQGCTRPSMASLDSMPRVSL